MEIEKLGNFLREHYLVTIAIILYICGYFPFIYNIYKKKNNNQKFKNSYYYYILLAFTLVLIHSVIVKHYEIVLFCTIKIIIALLIVGARMLYP